MRMRMHASESGNTRWDGCCHLKTWSLERLLHHSILLLFRKRSFLLIEINNKPQKAVNKSLCPAFSHLVWAASSFSMRVGWGLKTSSISLAPSRAVSPPPFSVVLSMSRPESSEVLVRLMLGPASWLLWTEALLQCELSPLSSAPLPFSIWCFFPRCSLGE